MEVDASHVIDGVSMVMQGKNLGTAYMYYQLPDNEKAVMRMKRNAKEDCLDCTMVYYANNRAYLGLIVMAKFFKDIKHKGSTT